MVLNKAERDALNHKIECPAKTVKCPRCGSEILYRELKNGIIVECKTPNCISGSIRGL